MKISLKTSIKFLLTLSMLIGIGICLYISATQNLSTNESLMLSLLLAIISIIASYIISNADSNNKIKDIKDEVQKTYNENLKTYANKAAEKVFNLSSELEKLKISLKNTLEDYEEDEHLTSREMLVLFIREKLSSTVHILETLKSNNDTFLSDWKGIIGDQIQLQQNLEAQIVLLSKELEELVQRKDIFEDELASSGDIEAIQKQIDSIESKLAEKVIALPYNVVPISAKKRRIDLVFECPNCSTKIKTNIRTKKGSKKILECAKCHKYLLCEYNDENDISVFEAPEERFNVRCPVCNEQFAECIPSLPGTVRKITCPSCSYAFSVSKAKDAVNIIQSNKLNGISEKTIELVLSKIPPEPWVQGMHKKVAEELGLSIAITSKIISKLIKEGKIQHSKCVESEEILAITTNEQSV